jgi:hypothetical protein
MESTEIMATGLVSRVVAAKAAVASLEKENASTRRRRMARQKAVRQITAAKSGESTTVGATLMDMTHQTVATMEMMKRVDTRNAGQHTSPGPNQSQ